MKDGFAIVLFMNEEDGLDGAKAYAHTHAAELGKHVAALEADAGGGAPRYVAVTGDDQAKAWLTKIAAPAAKLLPEPPETADGGGATCPRCWRSVCPTSTSSRT